ncbi:MAG: CopG family transcriptional regulator [Microcystis sp.]|jgi:metal-responsive CopG/Arc/MetJ family transcriptional regulator|uniref:CopG family transcriptional regulator n=1 Tax=Microcystis TaxID=1125 RepID=UPI000E3641C7|nr:MULTISPECIES: CopG family transcriptional regulator [Microcystis]NCQ92827.1 CopG family transcriptional regulator [Microcystis aeruginosa LG13-13]NCR05950.1 CopG family transcriptional regulator [Microcystis aeruginosa LG13-03]NCR64217.1 CopG family transcriptional regulator [Microcystis aeruginosa LG11-05]NCR73585.1 CopG family transcriptional regulator [Microcystis aeruginosa LG13-12]REJ49489.1 MAG: CopG family transcriptional regulator [Microcystis aeruginosa TA09]
MSSVSVGVRIPSNLYERLLAHASKVHASRSEVVISALAHYLGCTEDVPLSERLADLEAKVEELQVLVKK